MAGDSFAKSAEKLNVATATAEVYVIDLIAQGLGGASEHRRLLGELNVTPIKFNMVVEEISKCGIKLRDVKDHTALSYNQIRAVVAVLIQGFTF
jgi:hypothetical protein